MKKELKIGDKVQIKDAQFLVISMKCQMQSLIVMA